MKKNEYASEKCGTKLNASTFVCNRGTRGEEREKYKWKYSNKKWVKTFQIYFKTVSTHLEI